MQELSTCTCRDVRRLFGNKLGMKIRQKTTLTKKYYGVSRPYSKGFTCVNELQCITTINNALIVTVYTVCGLTYVCLHRTFTNECQRTPATTTWHNMHSTHTVYLYLLKGIT